MRSLTPELMQISNTVDKNRKLKEALSHKKSKLVEIGSTTYILIARLEERKKFNINKTDENTSLIENMKRTLGEKEAELKILNSETCYSSLDTERKLLDELKQKPQLYFNEIGVYESTLSKVKKFAVPYEEKYAMAVHLSNEDFAIADLTRNSQDFKIIGLVRDLLKYEDVYKKAVFAVAKDWMKCCIVPTVDEMIRLATYIKEKNLPRFKIISSELLNSVNREPVN